ncbi:MULTISPECIES: alkaline phosphatase D family protein [Nocardioides]|uniref:alkaline phosphatase D family protein n=1 Tax=Nocardioides TaxID=1839 RepID=UPI000330E3CA|nr:MULTISPECIES: alkaline phosphatase D family protein [Nocardioides]EON22257.1 alkaline phosphatase [Nocardioides sp. CF8]
MTQTSRPVPRRTILASAGALTAATAASAAASAGVAAKPGQEHRVFQHGVASGDPRPGRVVLWTRVTPSPDATPGSGRGSAVDVEWEVALDERFRKVVRRGTARTSAARDHTVKIDATRLAPDTWHFYRFRVGRHVSPVGRTWTAPRATASPDNLRLGVVSCANLQAGHFSAYRHLAKRDDLHAILHLGDYLYEYGPGQYGYGQSDVDVRSHVPAHEMVSLADYRQRHAQYKQDPDLQALHARYPFIVTWDDHEVTNDQWAEGAQNHQAAEGDYAARRARAHRAYDEWLPVLMEGTAQVGDGTRLFRELTFGKLAQLSMLDLRTHRDEQVPTTTPSPVPTLEARVSDPERTITGRAQLDWLLGALRRARPQWKLVGNPVMIAPVTFAQLPTDLVDPVNDVTGILPRDGAPYNVDQWDGYTDDRRELFTHIRDRRLRDVVFLTGDIHSAWACDLPQDIATYPLSESAGVEFVCSSVTSNNLKDITGTPARTSSLVVEGIIQANNRHVKYLNFDDHGFSVLDVTAARAQMDWFVIGDRRDPAAPASWSASWATASGANHVVPVAKPVA